MPTADRDFFDVASLFLQGATVKKLGDVNRLQHAQMGSLGSISGRIAATNEILTSMSNHLDLLGKEIRDIKEIAEQELAIHVELLNRDTLQAGLEEFIYQLEKMLKEFQSPEANVPLPAQYFALMGVVEKIRADGIGTSIIRGRENKAIFDESLQNAIGILDSLKSQQEVQAAIDWDKQETERKRIEDEKRRLEREEQARLDLRRREENQRVEELKKKREEREKRESIANLWPRIEKEYRCAIIAQVLVEAYRPGPKEVSYLKGRGFHFFPAVPPAALEYLKTTGPSESVGEPLLLVVPKAGDYLLFGTSGVHWHFRKRSADSSSDVAGYSAYSESDDYRGIILNSPLSSEEFRERLEKVEDSILDTWDGLLPSNYSDDCLAIYDSLSFTLQNIWDDVENFSNVTSGAGIILENYIGTGEQTGSSETRSPFPPNAAAEETIPYGKSPETAGSTPRMQSQSLTKATPTSPEERIIARKESSTQPAGEPGLLQAVDSGPNILRIIAEILSDYKSRGGTFAVFVANFHLYPDIPKKLLSKATSISRIDPDDEPILLVDCTVFHTAKDHVLFGLRNLYWSYHGILDQGSGSLDYSSLSDIRISGQRNNCVQLTPNEHVVCGTGEIATIVQSVLNIIKEWQFRVGGKGADTASNDAVQHSLDAAPKSTEAVAVATPSQVKKTVNAKEVVKDIRVGMSDERLMEKYGLTRKGLQSLFNKLVEARIISQSDLDRRPPQREH